MPQQPALQQTAPVRLNKVQVASEAIIALSHERDSPIKGQPLHNNLCNQEAKPKYSQFETNQNQFSPSNKNRSVSQIDVSRFIVIVYFWFKVLPLDFLKFV